MHTCSVTGLPAALTGGCVPARRKKLENRMGMEKNAAGHRLKVNRDFIGYFESARQQGEPACQT